MKWFLLVKRPVEQVLEKLKWFHCVAHIRSIQGSLVKWEVILSLSLFRPPPLPPNSFSGRSTDTIVVYERSNGITILVYINYGNPLRSDNVATEASPIEERFLNVTCDTLCAPASRFKKLDSDTKQLTLSYTATVQFLSMCLFFYFYILHVLHPSSSFACIVHYFLTFDAIKFLLTILMKSKKIQDIYIDFWCSHPSPVLDCRESVLVAIKCFREYFFIWGLNKISLQINRRSENRQIFGKMFIVQPQVFLILNFSGFERFGKFSSSAESRNKK